jgi:zinc transporter ZupT
MPFILALLGAVAGHFLGGPSGNVWGIAVGFAAGLAIAIVVLRTFGRLKRE